MADKIGGKTVRRFYRTAATTPRDDGHAVVLDDRPVKTPGARADLVVPSAPLAEAIAEEWDRQDEEVRPEDMPLTALACTALDVARPRRRGLVAGIVRYAETDMVCYRAPEPESLARREQELWQPLLDWLALAYDARLNTTTGIRPVEQPPEALNALERAVDALDEMRLATLSASVHAAGSLVVGLALIEGRVDADQAFEAAEVERTHQIQEWGEDAEAAEQREQVRAELDAAERFLRLLEG